MSETIITPSSPTILRQSIRKSNLQLAVEDIWDGVCSIHVWPTLGWNEVKLRYRRSLLGPFWLTLSTAILVLTMGPLYGKLFQQDISSYFLYLAISLVVWQLIAQTINDSCNAFIGAEGFIKQVRLPMTVHVLRGVWRNIVFFLHNLVFVALVIAYFMPPLWPGILLLPLALAAFAVNALWVGIAVGLVCARFRDIPQIIGNLVQVAFFLTPVLWQPHMLGRHVWVVDLNPFYHFLEIIRSPLMGTPLKIVSWGAVGGMTLFGYVLMLALFSRYRSRIAYWV